jgi:spermidine synthase
MLEIGLGIGSLPSILTARGLDVDVVEIDRAVVRAAREYFGFSTRGETFVEDARTFLRRTERRYDLIVHDTFTGGTTPEHLLSLEVLRNIHDLLHPGGVLALNFVGYEDGPHAEATLLVARTVRAVFPKVRTFRDSAPVLFALAASAVPSNELIAGAQDARLCALQAARSTPRSRGRGQPRNTGPVVAAPTVALDRHAVARR